MAAQIILLKIRFPVTAFTELKEKNPNFHIKSQKIMISQNNPNQK